MEEYIVKKRKKTKNIESLKVKGFFRLQITEDDINGKSRIVGDSGWRQNQVTNDGFKLYLADNIGKSSGSKQIAYVGIGTGGAPAATDTGLAGEVMTSTQRKAVTYSNVSSKTAQFTATFASSDSFVSAAYNISNIGLFATTTEADTIFAGNTYASSSLNTNQNLNITYQIRFS
jgi:hypothetical protein